MPDAPDTPESPDKPVTPSAKPPRMVVPGKGYREVTLSAIVFGLVVGVIMNAAITYSGLKIGFTIVGSAIAAVLGFGVLRGLLRRGSILECNIGQTIASSVNTTNAGVIFTVPVLLLLGYSLDPGSARFWLLTLACMAGAVMGAAFIIPLRKQMIDIDRLRFPSGTAVGAILKSPGAGVKKTIVLLAGIVAAMVLVAPAALTQLKTEADLDNLERLVAADRITVADRVRTLEIAEWIGDQSAPAELVERGNILAEIEDVKKKVRDAKVSAEDKARFRATIHELEALLDALAPAGDFNDNLFIALSEISAGEREWDTLRDKDLGWAKAPMFWGYADIGWRLPAEAESDVESAEPSDLDGDDRPDRPLSVRVDRSRNGHPDRVLGDESVDIGRFIGLPDSMMLVFAIAPFALGAGYLTGRAGLMVLAGGVLAYLVLNPILFHYNLMPATLEAHQVASFGKVNINRPLGIGLLLGGAMMGIVVSMPAIRAALKSLLLAGRTKGGRDELGLSPVLFAVLGAFVLLFLAADLSSRDPSNTTCPVTGEVFIVATGQPAPEGFDPDAAPRPTVQYGGYALMLADEDAVATWNEWSSEQRDDALAAIRSKPGFLSGLNPHLRAALIALVGTLWIWLAGIIIAQCTGMTDWSPVSGIALLTVVLVMFLAGTGNVIAAVLVGATLCCAITMASDMMADLRTGYIVGASPRKQQIVELCTTWIGPVVCMMTILLISSVNMKQYGVPMGEGTPTEAPQAQALQAVINGVQGGDMPYALYGMGALLGAMLGLGAFAGLGVLVGLSMYLPFIYISTYGIGCIANIVIGKIKGRSWAEEWGVPLAAGLIVGEAILSLIVSGIVLMRG